MKPLERQQLRNEAGREECIACGGSGLRSNGEPCHPCCGTGSRQKGGSVALVGDGPIVLPQHRCASVEHFTPADVVEAARGVMGGIDLDPASCKLANELIKAEVWYGPGSEFGEDGLAEPWAGRVFLNPPGGTTDKEYRELTKSNAALWWATLASAWQDGDVDQAVFVGFTLEILRSAQGVEVLQPLAFPLCVPAKRIAFDSPGDDNQRVPSRHPSHANVLIWLPNIPLGQRANGFRTCSDAQKKRFSQSFRSLGECRI